MARVRVTALQSVRRALGWASREVEFQGGSLEGLLKSVPIEGGGTLFDMLVGESGLKPEYALLVNGLPIAANDEKALQMDLGNGDQVVAMALVRVIRGGEKG